MSSNNNPQDQTQKIFSKMESKVVDISQNVYILMMDLENNLYNSIIYVVMNCSRGILQINNICTSNKNFKSIIVMSCTTTYQMYIWGRSRTSQKINWIKHSYQYGKFNFCSMGEELVNFFIKLLKGHQIICCQYRKLMVDMSLLFWTRM